MKSIAIVLVCFAVAASALTSRGFHPGRKHVAKHHAAVHDLEEVIASKTDLVDTVDKAIASVLDDMATLKHDLETVKEHEAELKKSLKGSDYEPVTLAEKDETPVAATEEKKFNNEQDDSEKATPAADEFAVDDAGDDMSTFLELENVNDDMNGGDDDDENAPALLMSRMHSHHLVQHAVSTKKYDGEEGVRFGVTGDGSRTQFEVHDDGSILYNPPPVVKEGMVAPNDASYRLREPDVGLRTVEIADVDYTAVPQDASIPGTHGKQWALKVGTNSTNDDDSVCVCKRRGAPRGKDRIRCKRNPETPTPTPTPTPPLHPNIVQCTNGTWAKDAPSTDAGHRDIICVYFPVRAPVPSPPPLPTPTPTPDYPPECYDPRNEFVAEGVEKVERIPFNSMLLEQGYEKCDC